MSAGAFWLASFLLLPFVGGPLLQHPAYRSLGYPARVVLSGATGAVLLSFVMTLGSLARLPWRLLPLLLVSLAVAFGLRRLVRAPDSPATARVPAESAGLAGVLSATAVGAVLLATLSGAAGSTDLLLFWGPKAQAFAAARGIDAEFLAGPQAAHMHPYYPPLVTNLYAFGALAAGRFPWGTATLTFPLALAALAVALPGVLRAASRPFTPAAVSALAVSALALLGVEADIAGNADTPLLLFELLGLALLLAPEPVDPARLLLAGLLFAGAATAKVEGLPFVLAAVALFLAARRSPKGTLRHAAMLLGPTVLALGAWFLFGAVWKAFGTYGEYGSIQDLRWDRLGLVLSEIGRTLWSNGFALPYLVPLAVLVASRAGIRRLPLAVAGALAAFLLVTYLLPVGRPALWIQWSAARTLSPIAGLLALSLAARRGQTSNATVSRSDSPEIQSPAVKDRGQ